jgi:hypothetical protein
MEILLIYIFICAISAGAAAKKGWNIWDSFGHNTACIFIIARNDCQKIF